MPDDMFYQCVCLVWNVELLIQVCVKQLGCIVAQLLIITYKL